MSIDFTFPLALCKAHYGIWLHALEMVETIGSRVLQDSIAWTRAQTDAVMRAEDWQALATAPTRVFPRLDAKSDSPASRSTPVTRLSRRTVVNEALRTLHTALAAAPVARRPHADRKSAAAKGKA